MPEKQLRFTNILLVLILLIMTLNLIIDLVPYIITGSLLRSFSRTNDADPFMGIYTVTQALGEGSFFITIPTQSP